MNKKRAIVYGIGRFYQELEQQINELYEVVAKVDRNTNFQNNIISLDEALVVPYDEIVITVMDVKICFDIVGILIKKYAVPYSKIKLGLNLKQNSSWDSLDVAVDGNISYNINGLSILVKNIDEFNNIIDIFAGDCYSYFLDNASEEIVLDIGMNVGGASLFFANKENVEKVYGYEPFQETYLQAKENFKRNGLEKNGRIECFPYGISDRNEIRQVMYNKNMTCGQSTNGEANTKARENYKEWDLIYDEDDEMAEIEVRDIKEVLTNIYNIHEWENIILKLDCEGEEYCIMDRLDEAGLFNRIRIIMLEWHYDGAERILEILRKNHYMYCNFNHVNSDNGFVYAFKAMK